MYSNRFCSYRGSYKPGLWTGPCHGLDCGLNSRPILWFAELVTGCSGKKRAWGLRYDCTYAMVYMHATLRGGLVTMHMAVSGPVMYLVPWACQGIYWGSYARVEA